MQNWITMRWGRWNPGTCPIPYILIMVYNPLLSYRMIIRMHTLLPYFPGLWLHLLQLWTLKFPSCWLIFNSYMCQLSCLYSKIWMISCMHLNTGLVSGVGGIISPSVTPCCRCYICCPFFLCLWNFFWDGNWKWNCYSLWFCGCFPVSLWVNHLQL